MDPTKVQKPDRIARLPVDARGYPIPWNVLRRTTGEPVFTVNDDRLHFEALRRELCPICGEHLGRWRWFVGGPASAFDPNGWYLDLPGHHECMTYALQVCPYLAMPRWSGRIDVPDMRNLPTPVLMNNDLEPERPELFVAVAGERIELRDRGNFVVPYVRPTRPYIGIEYWRHGERLDDQVGHTLAQEAMERRAAKL